MTTRLTLTPARLAALYSAFISERQATLALHAGTENAEAVAAYVAARDRRDAALARAGLPSYEDMSDHWFEAMTGKAR